MSDIIAYRKRAEILCAEWMLTPDGAEISTLTSLLLPVRQNERRCMLKITRFSEEQLGMRLMTWWDGNGAVPVLAHDDDALLMERVDGPRSLRAIAIGGGDVEATRILCGVIERLHEVSSDRDPPNLTSLNDWFAALFEDKPAEHPVITRGRDVARDLIANQVEPAVLHGDVHHDNVLDGGDRGWLIIDPKGLYGDRTFDYLNLLRNPNDDLALQPERFREQIAAISASAGLDRERLLRWVLAFCALSAVWRFNDAEYELDIAIAGMAALELGIDLASR